VRHEHQRPSNLIHFDIKRLARTVKRHRFTRPYTARTNGKAERFIQTVLSEWAYPGTYQNFAGHRARSTQGSTATTSTDSMLASTTIPQPHAQSLIRTTY